jgi:hypothetical protein
MSTSSLILPRYTECEYSLFVSYAHADDQANNSWVTALKQAIHDRLESLPRVIAALPLHFSGENGPSVGRLGHELQERVRKSFGMLLVVGEKYVSSGWCEKELAFFQEVFGAEGTKSRLLIAVMSQWALNEAKKGDQWRKIVAVDQLCEPMYKANYPREPIPAMLDNGMYAKTFFDGVRNLTEPLCEEIRRSFEEERTAPISQPKASSARTPWQATSPDTLSIAIGPVTNNLRGKAEVLKGALENAGASVTLLGRELADDYRPHNGSPLREVLVKADRLVVPIVNSDPLQGMIPGGHATILSREWSGLNKKKPIVWYRPDDVQVETDDRAPDEHLAVFKALAPVCASEEAVVNLLFGVNVGRALRIYIERHPQEPVYYRLARIIYEAWEKLPPDPKRPALRCELLDLDAIDTAAKDPAGVILLGPQGLKSVSSLHAQMNLVRESFPKSGNYPGFVALILAPPPPKQCPQHDWAGIKFYKYPEEPKLVIDEESLPWLEEFIHEVWLNSQNSNLEPAR